MDINKTHLGYADGWRIIYQARTVFAVLLLIAVLINLAVFFVAKFSGLTKSADMPIIVQPFLPGFSPMCPAIAAKPMSAAPTKSAATPAPAKSTPATAPAATQQAAPVPATPATPKTSVNKVPSKAEVTFERPADLDRALKWYSTFSNVMTLTSIIALVSIIFMVFCALAGMMMIVAGHLPGAGSITSAFFWSIGIVALLLPWTNFIPQATCLPIGIAAFTDIQASLRETCSGAGCGMSSDLASIIQLWVKYVVFPIIIILIDIMYLTRTRQAATDIRTMTMPPSEARSQM
jgi:hypothetical protein